MDTETVHTVDLINCAHCQDEYIAWAELTDAETLVGLGMIPDTLAEMEI